jgi:hypothetical protein
MTAASHYLVSLARRLAAGYATLPGLRAFMVTGSAAEGKSDFYSDLDMTAYYDELPSEDDLARVREQLGGSARIWVIGDRAEGGFAEAFMLDGVECQIGHTAVATWESEIAEVLDKPNADTPLHKAMEGTLKCIALHGEPLIETWKARIAAYSDGLARAMVEQHLRFPAMWLLHERLQTRDGTIWHYQALVELSHNVLAVLAGLNRKYFTSFQFKRMGAFCAELAITPPDLADRIEMLFGSDRKMAVEEAERLVSETLALVQEHMREVDANAAGKRIGQRSQPWLPAA